MLLNTGTRLGPYEILDPIGAGGMGEVYRARDTRLDRTVAIKVLPSHLAADPQFRERFDREARTISSLDHPHICALYDVGEEHGTLFLVMQYLEGETLAERLKKGALPLDQALSVAIQIGDALATAHRADITHRDLKPGNIMLTSSKARGAPPPRAEDILTARGAPPPLAGAAGALLERKFASAAYAKLLDFGLAKTSAPAVAQGFSPANPSMLPTTPPNLTAQGTILGTFQYMAPEQLEGQEADARTDIFAFGAVLYEMLTGRKAFEGKTQASLIGAILKDTPRSIASLQPLTPAALDRVVTTCLAKDPDDRWQSARDMMRELKWIQDAPAPAEAGVKKRSLLWRAGVALLLLILTSGLIAAGRYFRAAPLDPADGAPVVFTVAPPENTTFVTPQAANGLPWLALSPDGRVLTFVALSANGHQQLWTRPLASAVAKPLAGTDGASAPFWSPDSQFIAFFAQGKLKYVDTRGGTPQIVTDATGGGGGSWGPENIIVFNAENIAGELRKINVGSRTSATPVTRVDTAKGQRGHVWPAFLPDGRHFLFAVQRSGSGGNDVLVGSLDGDEPKFLLRAEGNALYASGYIFYRRAGTLMAERFDAPALRLGGDPVRIVEGVGSNGATAYSAFSVSATGALAYGANMPGFDSRLVWRDRTGGTLNVIGIAQARSPSLSHDGGLLALEEAADIWLYDAKRGRPLRFTFDAVGAGSPIWSPDGKYVAFKASHGGRIDQLFRKPTNGSGAEEQLSDVEGSFPTDWSADGRFIVFHSQSPGKGWDVWHLPLADDKARPLITTPFNEFQGTLSRDGRWIAYASVESGVVEVYVQPFPPTGAKWLVSRDGGAEPRWRADGRELFYVSADKRLMAVPVTGGATFESGKPETLFEMNIGDLVRPFARRYAVTPDGQRFVIAERTTHDGPPPLTVVVNWRTLVDKH